MISSPRPIDGAEESEEAPDIGLLLSYNVVVRAEGLGSLAKSAREPDPSKEVIAVCRGVDCRVRDSRG